MKPKTKKQLAAEREAAREARPKEFSDEATHLFKLLRYTTKNEHIPKTERFGNKEVSEAILFLENKYHNDAFVAVERKIEKEKEVIDETT
jgi:hypothetical protein